MAGMIQQERTEKPTLREMPGGARCGRPNRTRGIFRRYHILFGTLVLGGLSPLFLVTNDTKGSDQSHVIQKHLGKGDRERKVHVMKHIVTKNPFSNHCTKRNSAA